MNATFSFSIKTFILSLLSVVLFAVQGNAQRQRTVGDSIALMQQIYTSMHNVNVLIEQKYEYQAALQSNDTILLQTKSLCGECSIEHRRTLLLKADLLTYLGNYNNATEMYEQCLILQEKCGKSKSYNTAFILYHYGLMNTNIEEIEKADTCYTKALQLLDDLKIAKSDNLYNNVVKAQEALKYYMQSELRRYKQWNDTAEKKKPR
jgi:tetratricopeptide (TPR) repeat protein